MGLIGDVTPGITALSAQLPGIIQTLTGAGHDDIAQLLTGAQADIDRMITGELTVIKAAEDPILSRLDQIISIGQKFGGFSNGFTVTVAPKGDKLDTEPGTQRPA